MRLDIPYDRSTVGLDVDDTRLIGTLMPNDLSFDRTGTDAVEWALDHPDSSPRLESIVQAGEKVVIVTSDITRPMPSQIVLPPVLQRLNSAGISDEDICIVFALGSHRRHTEDEMISLVGKAIYDRIKCIDSDTSACTYIGTSRLGTQYAVFKDVVEADRIICLANIEFHYFAGYSGGAKSIMPGVSDLACIQNNHSGMVREEARAGHMSGNPVREDINEITSFIRVDFIVNVILDEHKNIVHAVAGDVIKAHERGCRFLDQLYKVIIPKKADIVIVSAGGYPKDINLYQAQKALDNAKYAVQDGGVIIWVASSKQGLENEKFEKWMKNYNPEFMITEIQRHFQLGAHKAAAIALVLRKARIFLVSDLEPDLISSIRLEPKSSVQEALTDATIIKGEQSSILFMPFGGSTLPVEA